ncbi:Hypothetical predicted protein [Octopus vulgaris]|uniref:Uncharacterized protein n=1 Tax=Octopus vulgaris TaxID=6645 RepID=A0AA36AT23_OCTVU|nr:Hypothetical predicted protein [Octopus vulgaris]
MDKENASHFVIEDTKQVLLEKTRDEMLMEVASEEHVAENSQIRESEPSVPSTENASLRNRSNANTLKDNESLQNIPTAPSNTNGRTIVSNSFTRHHKQNKGYKNIDYSP